MSDKFDKHNRPIGLVEWAKLFEDREYKVVKQSRLWNGVWVSTIWLGLDHSFGRGRMQIFETMVFSLFGEELSQLRYSSFEEAEWGHSVAVKYWRNPFKFFERFFYLFKGITTYRERRKRRDNRIDRDKRIKNGK